MRKILIACVATALLVGGGTATAASLITGANVKNGSLTGADVKNGSLHGADLANGTVKLRDLSPGVRALIAKAGTPGKNGATGPQGSKGDTGATGPQGNGVLPNGFARTNGTVHNTANGIEFGPYEDGGVAGGSLRYSGLNGKKLSDISKLTYTASYSTDNDTDVAVPYLRVFLNGDNDDVIFSPNTQPSKQTSEDTPHTWNVTTGTVRYNDDAGNSPDESWANVVAAHGNDVISGVYVSTGFSAGTNLTAWLTDFSANDQAFIFGS